MKVKEKVGVSKFFQRENLQKNLRSTKNTPYNTLNSRSLWFGDLKGERKLEINLFPTPDPGPSNTPFKAAWKNRITSEGFVQTIGIIPSCLRIFLDLISLSKSAPMKYDLIFFHSLPAICYELKFLSLFCLELSILVHDHLRIT